jgi:hypothetical protein
VNSITFRVLFPYTLMVVATLLCRICFYCTPIAPAKAEGKFKGRKRTLNTGKVRELVNRATAWEVSRTALATVILRRTKQPILSIYLSVQFICMPA